MPKSETSNISNSDLTATAAREAMDEALQAGAAPEDEAVATAEAGNSEKSEPAGLMTPESLRLMEAIKRQSEMPPEPTSEDYAVIWEEYRKKFATPKECLEGRGREWDWRWCENDQRELGPLERAGWVIVNRVRAPFLPERMFSSLGVIEFKGHSQHFLLMRSLRWKEIEDQQAINQHKAAMATFDDQIDSMNKASGNLGGLEKLKGAGGPMPEFGIGNVTNGAY